MLDDVLDDHAFELGVFLGGGDVQGLDAQLGDAVLGQLVHGGVDGEDGLAFSGELFADDVGGEGHQHGVVGGLVVAFDGVDGGAGRVHAGAEGDEQDARAGEGGNGGEKDARQRKSDKLFHKHSLSNLVDWMEGTGLDPSYVFRLVSRLEVPLPPRLPVDGVHSGSGGFIPSHGCGSASV